MASCARLPTAQSAPHGNGLKRHLEPRWIQSPNAMPCCRMAQKLPAGFAYAYRTTPAIFGTVCQSVIRNCLSRCSRWFLAPSALAKTDRYFLGRRSWRPAATSYRRSEMDSGQRIRRDTTISPRATLAVEARIIGSGPSSGTEISNRLAVFAARKSDKLYPWRQASKSAR